MDINHLIDQLNDKQREAVCAPVGNMLILAGAGSGKTRVLVSRICWLIEAERASPHSIVAVTFTNKAAAEMRGRLEQILGYSVAGMWVGTFHGLAHRLLRAHWQAAGLVQQFQILDGEDQLRIIKRVIRALELDEDQWEPRRAQWYINSKKDAGLRPKHIDARSDVHEKTFLRIYEAYEDACQRSGVVDFAELLLRAHELWLQNPEILQHYQSRFSHILVDEFQDTNTIQYAWLKLLAGQHASVMIVGDDDQSIYSWRGAQVANIKRFLSDFHHPVTVRLEQNYRSTETILTAANALIGNNDGRMGKELWTAGAKGDPIALYAAFNDLDEARFIVEYLHAWYERHHCYRDIAILYRSNAQSRVLEEALLRRGIPYRVYGGLRFFERAEIKDALAYLRLMANRDDDGAFERIVNTPTRGIGEKTLEEIRNRSRDNNISLWQSSREILAAQMLTARAEHALSEFCQLIDDLDQETSGDDLDESTKITIHRSGLWAHYSKVKGEKAQAKLDNLQELVSAAKEFEPDPDTNMPLLSAFLSHAALESGEQQSSDATDYVQLMTLHSAKGLEFPLVFLSGVEEGLFPHRMSQEEPGRMEEERRLCYVGMTRAMQQLVMTYAEIRRTFGRDEYHRASRFITELPKECIKEIRLKNTPVARVTEIPATSIKNAAVGDTGFNIGAAVFHAKFGEGKILNFEGSGPNTRIQVQFNRHHGTKWLVMSFANLQLIDTSLESNS